MKTLYAILNVFSLSALLLAGCVNEDPQYMVNGGGETPSPDKIGYLTPGEFGLRVLFDTETEIDPDDTGDSKPSLSSRANPDADSFTIEILDAAQASVKKMSYGEWKAQSGPIALPVGNYQLKVYSDETIPDAAWEHPVYAASRDFSIRKAETTTLPDIVCTLANIKVTMDYSVDLKDWLSNETFAEFTLGSQKATFVKGETRAVYFRPENASNTINFRLEGKFADTDRPVALTKTITDARAGQWRKVSLVIQNADKGNITLDIKIDTFVQDEEIVVDGTEGLWEEKVEEIDPSVPVIRWPGHDLSKQFRLLASMFEGETCTEPFALEVASPNGIQSLEITIGSDNAEFLAALSALQIPSSFDLCSVTPASGALYTTLKGLGLPLGDEVTGKKKLTVDIAPQMWKLYAFDGAFTFGCTAADTNGKSTTATLSLLVDKQSEQSAPVIVWRGYDIEKPHKMTGDMQIAVDVTSTDGIGSFVITIDSEVLKPFLEEIGLPSQFDLCTSEGEQAELLNGLGFPTGKDVVSPLSFNITQFVTVLMMMDAGEHKFILTVTNEKGTATTKTIHLINEK